MASWRSFRWWLHYFDWKHFFPSVRATHFALNNQQLNSSNSENSDQSPNSEAFIVHPVDVPSISSEILWSLCSIGNKIHACKCHIWNRHRFRSIANTDLVELNLQLDLQSQIVPEPVFRSRDRPFRSQNFRSFPKVATFILWSGDQLLLENVHNHLLRLSNMKSLTVIKRWQNLKLRFSNGLR